MVDFAEGNSRRKIRLFEVILVVLGLLLFGLFVIMWLSGSRVPSESVRALGMLSAVEIGLEMYRSDYDHYPESRVRPDPIFGWPKSGMPDGAWLSGAHWLTRALIGHDSNGIDCRKKALGSDGQTWIDYQNLTNENRKGLYFDVRQEQIRYDTDSQKFYPEGNPSTGRPVLVDNYGFPILYYRANNGTLPFATSDPKAIYNHDDNARITGSDRHSGWNFAGVKKSEPLHPLAIFGSTDPAHVADPPPGLTGYTFTGFLHNDRVLAEKGTVHPYNSDRSILISAGQDGRYGTADDITNFPQRR